MSRTRYLRLLPYWVLGLALTGCSSRLAAPPENGIAHPEFVRIAGRPVAALSAESTSPQVASQKINGKQGGAP